LVQPLVGLLRGLVGGFGALGRALHPRVELIEARVDPCEIVVVGRAAGKTHRDNGGHAERTRHCLVLFGQKHAGAPSSGISKYNGVLGRCSDPASADVGMGGKSVKRDTPRPCRTFTLPRQTLNWRRHPHTFAAKAAVIRVVNHRTAWDTKATQY